MTKQDFNDNFETVVDKICNYAIVMCIVGIVLLIFKAILI
jgi:hypothetical protein